MAEWLRERKVPLQSQDPKVEQSRWVHWQCSCLAERWQRLERLWILLLRCC